MIHMRNYQASATKARILKDSPMSGSSEVSSLFAVWTATASVHDHFRKELADLRGRVIKIEDRKNNETLYSTRIFDLSSSQLSLKRPLDIVIEKYDDEYIARVPELEIFGPAATESEAIMNLKQEIIALYDDLKGLKDKEMGLLPLTWKRVLKALIREVK